MWTCTISTLTALALSASLANAAEKLPERLVCYDDIFQPFFMYDGEKYTGLNVDLVSEAGRRLGIAMEFRQIPFKRLELEISRGDAANIQCGFSFSRTEAREKTMTFGRVSIQSTDYTLFVRTDQNGIETLDALTGKAIGVRSGFRLPDVIAEGARNKRWKIDEAGSDEVNFKKLALGRVDAALANREVGLYTLHTLKMERIHAMSPPLVHFDTFMVFSKSQSAEGLADAFDRALSAMNTDGTVQRLREKYFLRDGP